MATEKQEMSNKDKATGIGTLIVIGVIIVGIIIIANIMSSGGDTKTTTQTQTIDTTLPDDEQLQQIVKNSLTTYNNDTEDQTRKIDVVKRPDGGYGVFVEYNADAFNKLLINGEMASIYIALYTSDKDVQSASVSAYSPMIDKYGNSSDVLVYKSILDKATADKVNFTADRAALEVSILPGVWDIAIKHQDLK
jgi:hypothetical protein